MRARFSLLVSLLAAIAAGCTAHQVPPGPEPSVTLGAQAMPGYHISPGANTAIPGGDIGYLVTANGQGGYRVVFTDTAGSSAVFSATLSTDGTFDTAPQQTRGFSGNEQIQIVAPNRISVTGVPGASLEGLDTVSSTDPIYLDAIVDGSRQVNIYFTGAHAAVVQTSGFDPVAFTSP